MGIVVASNPDASRGEGDTARSTLSSSLIGDRRDNFANEAEGDTAEVGGDDGDVLERCFPLSFVSTHRLRSLGGSITLFDSLSVVTRFCGEAGENVTTGKSGPVGPTISTPLIPPDHGTRSLVKNPRSFPTSGPSALLLLLLPLGDWTGLGTGVSPSTKAAICVNAQSLARALHAQVVNVDPSACRTFAIWLQRCESWWGLVHASGLGASVHASVGVGGDSREELSGLDERRVHRPIPSRRRFLRLVSDHGGQRRQR